VYEAFDPRIALKGRSVGRDRVRRIRIGTARSLVAEIPGDGSRSGAEDAGPKK